MFDSLKIFLDRFIKLSEAEYSQLKEKIIIRHFLKKEIMIRAGDTEHYLYFINKGLIRQYFVSGKEELVIDIISEGTITGSVTSFLSGAPSRYFMETMEPTSVFALSKKDLEALYLSDNKWEKFGRILTTHFFLQQEKHILDNIRLPMKERVINFVSENPNLLQRVPQKYLASYLDIKPETFSRMKHLLFNKRITKVQTSK